LYCSGVFLARSALPGSLWAGFVLGAAGDQRLYNLKGDQDEKARWLGNVRSIAWLSLTVGDERQRG